MYQGAFLNQAVEGICQFSNQSVFSPIKKVSLDGLLLRHSMSFELMMEGMPVPIIQQQLGHASLATTQRYLDHIAPKDLVEAMQRRVFEV